MVRVSVLRPIFKTLVRRGAPLSRYVDRAMMVPSILENPEAFIPLRQASQVLYEAAAGEGLPDLGLLAGRQARFEDLGVYGCVVRRSSTLGDALRSLIAFSIAFNSGERWSTDVRDGEVRLLHRYVEPIAPGYGLAEQYAIALVLNLARLAAPSWTPREVRWQTAHAPAVADSDLFRGTRLLFSQAATMVTLPLTLMHQRLPKAPTLAFDPREVEDWRHRRPPPDLAGGIREVIAAVGAGHPRIDRTAGALGVSVRTLQRRLSGSGLRFERIVQTMRLDMATDLLERTDARVLDIALDLGYSDHAHFTRAFHNWTGLSPLEYRRRRRPEYESAPARRLSA